MAESNVIRKFQQEVARLVKNSSPNILAEALAKRGSGQVTPFHEEYAKLLQNLSQDEIAELLIRQDGGEVSLWDNNINHPPSS